MTYTTQTHPEHDPVSEITLGALPADLADRLNALRYSQTDDIDDGTEIMANGLSRSTNSAHNRRLGSAGYHLRCAKRQLAAAMVEVAEACEGIGNNSQIERAIFSAEVHQTNVNLCESRYADVLREIKAERAAAHPPTPVVTTTTQLADSIARDLLELDAGTADLRRRAARGLLSEDEVDALNRRYAEQAYADGPDAGPWAILDADGKVVEHGGDAEDL